GARLDRLARLERFYEGPIPPPLRAQVLGEPSAPDRFEAGQWATLFQESRERIARLRRRAGTLSHPPAPHPPASDPTTRDDLALALRQERAWMRQCYRRWQEEPEKTPHETVTSPRRRATAASIPNLQGTVSGARR